MPLFGRAIYSDRASDASTRGAEEPNDSEGIVVRSGS